MEGNDPMHFPNRSIDSPDDDDDDPNHQNFELLDDFLLSDDWVNDDLQAPVVFGHPYGNPVYASTAINVGGQSSSVGHDTSSRSTELERLQENSIDVGASGSGSETAGKAHKATKERIAFKTKSVIEILDDGFKWRKYGKKMVKNSPNPRNYYRCSVEGCSVKKRVERDVEDPSYVITTYEGVHNHEGPFKL